MITAERMGNCLSREHFVHHFRFIGAWNAPYGYGLN